MDFNYFSKLSIEEQNVRPARNNEIINCYFKVLTEIKNLNLLIKPSSFEVLTKFKKDNFRFIHVSTDEVYGDLKKNYRSNEKSPYQPSSPYPASKASSDNLIQSAVDKIDNK